MPLQLQGVQAAVGCSCSCSAAWQLPQRSVLASCRVPASCDAQRSTRHRHVAAIALSPTTFALMCADAIVLTDFCAPVQQDSIEHRGASLGGSIDSGWAHGSSSVQREERCSPRP